MTFTEKVNMETVVDRIIRDLTEITARNGNSDCAVFFPTDSNFTGFIVISTALKKKKQDQTLP